MKKIRDKISLLKLRNFLVSSTSPNFDQLFPLSEGWIDRLVSSWDPLSQYVSSFLSIKRVSRLKVVLYPTPLFLFNFLSSLHHILLYKFSPLRVPRSIVRYSSRYSKSYISFLNSSKINVFIYKIYVIKITT